MKGLVLASLLLAQPNGEAAVACERNLEHQPSADRIWHDKPVAMHLRAGQPVPLPGMTWKLELLRVVWAPCPPEAMCVVSGWKGARLRLHGPDGQVQDIRAVNMIGQQAPSVRSDAPRLCLRVPCIDPDTHTALIEVVPGCPPPEEAGDR